MRPIKLFRFLLILVLLARWPFSASAAEILVVSQNKKIYPVAPHSDFLESAVQSGEVTKYLPAFKKFDYRLLKISNDTSNVFWFRFTVQNKTNENLYLVLPVVGFISVKLYHYQQGKAILLEKAGTHTSVTKKLLATNRDIMRLPLQSGETKTFLLRLNHFNYKAFPAAIYPEDALIKYAHPWDTAEGILLGIMLAVVIYQASIYLVTKEKDYLLLALYLASLSAHLTIYSGHFYELFSFIPANLFNRFDSGLPSVTGFLSFLFTYHFLNLNKEASPHLKKVFFGFYTAWVFLILAALLGFTQIAYGYKYISPVASIFLIYLGITFYLKGHKHAILYLIAYSITTLTIIFLITYYILGIFTYSRFLHNSLILSFDAHALLFSVAVAYKIKTYKDQVAEIIKAQNILLEKSVADRTQKLQQSLENLKAAQAKLIQQEKLASLGELTAGIAHEIQNPLNFVNNFAEVSEELCEELQDEFEILALPPDQKKPLADLIDDLTQNQGKIKFHGKRADSIVKNMLQHSNVNAGQKELTGINNLTEEFLRLSYHGLRAKDKNFNARLQTNFADNLPDLAVQPQDLGRVLLNIFNNAFYALAQKKNQLNGLYMPEMQVSTRYYNGKVEITIRDNGTGIPENIKNKIFQPFFTTKPTGQGTGLGLSLSYDIITKGHGGDLKVNSKEGEFTEMVLQLPVPAG